MDQPSKAANLARGPLNREKEKIMYPFAPENLVSRDRFGRRVPRYPPGSGTYLRDSFRFPIYVLCNIHGRV